MDSPTQPGEPRLGGAAPIDSSSLQERVADAHRTSEEVRGDAAGARQHAIKAREQSLALRGKVGALLAEMRRKRDSR